MNTARHALKAALICMLWLAAVPAHADSLVAVDIANLTFQAARGNNSCAGLPCTETFNITFHWDTTTNSFVGGTGVVNASGALPASDLPAANNWTFANNVLYVPGLLPGLGIESSPTAPQDDVVLFDPHFIFPLIPGSYSYSGAQMLCFANGAPCDSLFDFTTSQGVFSATPIAGTINITPLAPVPEPSTLLLLGTGLLGVGRAVRRKWLA